MRQIIFYKNYFREFYDQQEERVQEKIDFVLDLIVSIERVPEKFLKHLSGTDGLYEVRVKSSSNIFRIFCFFDEGKVVVLLHGFNKKTDKTPSKELERASKLKKEYFTDKAKSK